MTSPPSTGWLSSMSKGGKWLAGVIVVALVGALVSQIVPRMFGPEELGAQLSDVSLDANVTLDEYAIRHADSTGRADAGPVTARDGRPSMMLVAARSEGDPASAIDGDTSGAAKSGDSRTSTSGDKVDASGTSTRGDKAGDTRTTTTDGGRTTTTDGSTGGGRTTTTGGGRTTTTGGGRTTTLQDGVSILPLEIEALDRRKLAAGVEGALDELGATEPLMLTATCLAEVVSPECGLSSMQAQLVATDDVNGATEPVSQVDVAQRLAKIFRGSRTVRAQSDPSKRELIGVTVNFKVALTGFRGRTAEVRWSLYRARQSVRVPRDWLRNQRAMLLRGQADRDSASGEFWIPIPQLKGPFFVRLALHDAAGTRLDFADTKSFR